MKLALALSPSLFGLACLGFGCDGSRPVAPDACLETPAALSGLASGPADVSRAGQVSSTGTELDADGDGFPRAGKPVVDCDDDAPYTYPGAQERFCDGLDRDCDREACLDRCGPIGLRAGVTYRLVKDLLEVEGTCFDIDQPGVVLDGRGHRLTSARRPGVVLGGPGSSGSHVRLLLNRTGKPGVPRKVGWIGTGPQEIFRNAVAADLDDDGELELLVSRLAIGAINAGGSWSGAAYLFLGRKDIFPSQPSKDDVSL